MRIAQLASLCRVSEPTVIRFCRAIGFDGFQSFKLQLAQQLGSGGVYRQFAVDSRDTVQDLRNKVFDTTVGSLIGVRDELDPIVLERAINALTRAQRVEFYGFGASGSVAADAQHKFFRFNIPVTAYDDVMMMRMVAAAAHTGDVIVMISYTGRTRELVEIARIARESGATVLGITAQNSPLTKECTVLLEAPTPEDTDVYMPMVSRIVQLALLDVLATGVILRRGVGFHSHLKKIKDSLKDTRYPSED